MQNLKTYLKTITDRGNPGLAASIFHFGQVQIPELKKILRNSGVQVRL